MAPKLLVETPPSSGSSEASSDEGEHAVVVAAEEDEAATSKPAKKKPPPTTMAAAPFSDSDSADDSESDSESDSDSAESKSGSEERRPTPGPLVAGEGKGVAASKTRKTKKPPAPAAGPGPRPSLSKKKEKAAPVEAPSLSKKKEKAPVEAEAEAEGEDSGWNEPKRHLFQRIWTLEDELTILHRLAEYRAVNGSIPTSFREKVTFLNTIQASLSMEVHVDQLTNKIRRLRQTFKTTCKKCKEGEEPRFSTEHAHKAYELSKKVWDVKKAKSVWDVKKEAKSPLAPPKAKYPYLREAVDMLLGGNSCGGAAKRSLEMLDDSKAGALNERYKKLKLDQVEIHLRRADLEKETANLLREVLLNEDN